MITKTTTSPCVLSTNPYPTPLPDPVTFNTRYWAAQDPRIQARVTITPGVPSPFFEPLDEATARTLSDAGVVIDYNIMVIGWEPYDANFQRLLDGWLWSPNAFQPAPTIAPGVVMPGQVSYDPNHPPVGAISNSLNLLDYPPAIVQPAPAPGPGFIDLVGEPTGTMYNWRPSYNSAPSTDSSAIPPNGMFFNPRGEFQKILIKTPFGAQIFWVLVQASA